MLIFYPFCIYVSVPCFILQGHRLKNSKCKLLREIKRIPMDNKLLLTGTPLQNNLAELWSLLNFILPDIFSSHQEFESWYNSPSLSFLYFSILYLCTSILFATFSTELQIQYTRGNSCIYQWPIAIVMHNVLYMSWSSKPFQLTIGPAFI